MKIPFDWQVLSQEKSGGMSRAKVWKGWIVNSVIAIGENVSISSIFIPDENHEWEIDE